MNIDEKEELSFQFSQNHSVQIQKYEKSIYDWADRVQGSSKKWIKKASPEDIKKRIQYCNLAITNFNAFKNYCYASEGGKIYFQEMWEHLHNRKNPCFSYIDQIIDIKTTLEDALLR